MDSDWIISRPDLLAGKPCVKDTRISVEFILELLASGASQQDILASYPQLRADSLAAALRFAAENLRGEIVWPKRDTA